MLASKSVQSWFDCWFRWCWFHFFRCCWFLLLSVLFQCWFDCWFRRWLHFWFPLVSGWFSVGVTVGFDVVGLLVSVAISVIGLTVGFDGTVSVIVSQRKFAFFLKPNRTADPYQKQSSYSPHFARKPSQLLNLR